MSWFGSPIIDSTANDADRWYIKILPPNLHLAPGYTSSLSRVFKYFSTFLSTYRKCLCLICSISCFVWALTSLLNNQRQEYFTFPPLTILAMFCLLWNEQFKWTASGSTWYIASFKPLAWLVMMVVSNLLSDGCRLLANSQNSLSGGAYCSSNSSSGTDAALLIGWSGGVDTCCCSSSGALLFQRCGCLLACCSGGGAAVGTAMFGRCGCPPGGGIRGATCCPSHSPHGSSWLWWHFNELGVCGEMKNYAARQIGGLWDGWCCKNGWLRENIWGSYYSRMSWWGI